MSYKPSASVMTPLPLLSIVIPTLGRSTSLEKVIAGVQGQVPARDDLELLVVLDAEAPDASSAAIANGEAAAVSVIRAGRPGASAARNAGWRAARAPLILFLDDDIVPRPTLVAQHLTWHERDPEPEVAVLGLVEWSPAVKVTPFMRWLEMGIQFDYGTIRGAEIEWQRLYSCNVSLKRSILERVGGFDEERFPYGYEDLELGRRLSDEGLRLLYNADAVGEHLKTETLDGWRRNLRRIAQSERRFTSMYPSERPYFYELFCTAAGVAPARGRSARLARYVKPEMPWLGRVVWTSYDMVCRQRLATEFLAEWETALAAEEA